MTLANGPAWTAGRVGSAALSFDGVNDYARNANFSWPTGGAVTVSFWVNTPGGTNGGAFSVGGQNAPNRFSAHVPWPDNMLYWDYGDFNGTGRVSTNCAPYLNQWTHVALVSGGNGGAFKGIYINGILVASGTVSDGPDIPLTGINVGRILIGTTSYWHKGQLDDVQIYNRVLTPTEIVALASR